MTTEQLYKKADRADDVCDADIEKLDARTVIERTYEAWLDTYDHIHNTCQTTVPPEEPLYESACRIIRPYGKTITGALTEKDFEVMVKLADRECMMNATYMSAVLNETDARMLTLSAQHWEFQEHNLHCGTIGYRLKQGKVLKLLKGVHGEIGAHATGGAVISNDRSYRIGTEASDGIFINKGYATEMGTGAKGGVFLNLASGVLTDFGCEARGGIFLSTAANSAVGYGASPDCVFVFRDGPNADNRVEKQAAHMVGPEELAKDKELSDLMDIVEAAGNEGKYNKVKRIARVIDEHVRAKYGRKIA